jgi:hypothetical protein
VQAINWQVFEDKAISQAVIRADELRRVSYLFLLEMTKAANYSK